jgi:D-lactate dehydrogenase
MNITFFSSKNYDNLSFTQANDNFQYKLNFLDVKCTEQSIELAKKSDAICTFVNDHINASMMHALAQMNIRIIALRCAGFNQVDLKAAAEYGIRVVRVPAYSPEAVAEHAFALILGLNRKTHKAYNRIREGNFSIDKLQGFTLAGKKIGIIGTGNIGSACARIALGFGMKIYAYDPSPSESMQNLGVHYCTLDTLLEHSDIISLHCPLNDHTRYLIDTQSLNKMKKGVMLINTSRGGLVDTKAAINALKSGQIAALGVDVYEEEEHLFFEDYSESLIDDEVFLRLMTFPNVLITGHQAFLTHEALSEIAHTTLNNITALKNTQSCINEVQLT